MSSKFDWREETDVSWDEYATADDHRAKDRRLPGRWPWILIVILVIVSGGLLAFRQIQAIVGEQSSSIEEDVLASHALVMDAVDNGDIEVIASFLSAREPEWTKAQLELADQGLFLDRSPFGLAWIGTSSTPATEVTLDAALTSAEVKDAHEYRLDSGNGLQDKVTLLQTAIYRLGADRWLLSPPRFDYWGEWRTAEGRYLTLAYPERDAEISERLAADLESALGQACNTLPGMECPPGAALHIRFVANPNILITMANPESRLQAGLELELPTPSLVGLPENEGGYRAIYRGYAHWVVSALINEIAGWQCCSQPLFYLALVDYQLRQLGLAFHSPGKLEYDQLRGQTPLSAAQYWNTGRSLSESLAGPEWPGVNLLVEFMVAEIAALSPFEMQRLLNSSSYFDEWFLQVVQNNLTDRQSLDQAWARFLEGKQNPPA